MNKHIFREYDIRGIVGTDFLLEEAGDLVRAIVSYFISKNKNLRSLVIGMDGRNHSPRIRQEALDAICEAGIDVYDIGVCPTPVFYFSLYNSPATSGFIITASHNPKEYNGFKICFEQTSVCGNELLEIHSIYESKKYHNARGKRGTIYSLCMNERYISWMSEHFSSLKAIDFPCAIDCANGAAGTIIPGLIKAMNWKKVTLLYPEVDGNFPHHEADPTVVSNMIDLEAVMAKASLPLGIGFDGDCDRMAPLCPSGRLVLGDELLALFAEEIIKKNPGAPIVFDIKSSQGLIEFLLLRKAVLCIAPSGHSKIKAAMRENKALLAGELSCHFFFKDRYFGYDDGIYAMMRLIEIVVQKGANLDEILSHFPRKVSSDEIRIACKEEDKIDIVEHVRRHCSLHNPSQLITIDGVRAHLFDGWGLARASNTQPVISLRFEADTLEGLAAVKKVFVGALEKYYDSSFLQGKIGF